MSTQHVPSTRSWQPTARDLRNHGEIDDVSMFAAEPHSNIDDRLEEVALHCLVEVQVLGASGSFAGIRAEAQHGNMPLSPRYQNVA